MLARLKDWAESIRRDAVALFIAARDPRTPWQVKAVAGLVAAYALSPIDLIPDFIPVVGCLDDLIIVPIGIWVVVSLMPAGLMQEFRAAAARRDEKPRSKSGAAVIIAIWLASAALLLWLLRAWIFRLNPISG